MTLDFSDCASGAQTLGDRYDCEGLADASSVNDGAAFITFSGGESIMFPTDLALLRLDFEPTISAMSFTLDTLLSGSVTITKYGALGVVIGSPQTAAEGPVSITGSGITRIDIVGSIATGNWTIGDISYTTESAVTGCSDCEGTPEPPPPPPPPPPADFDEDSIPDSIDDDDDNDGVDDDDDDDDFDKFFCGVDTDQDTCDDCSAGDGTPSVVTDGVNSNSDPGNLCDKFDRKALNLSSCNEVPLEALFACDGIASGLTAGISGEPLLFNSAILAEPGASSFLTFTFSPPISRFSFVATDSGTPFTTGTVNGDNGLTSIAPVSFVPGAPVEVTGSGLTTIVIETNGGIGSSWGIQDVSLDPVSAVVGCDATCTGTPNDDLDEDDIRDSIDPDIDGDGVDNDDDSAPLLVAICGVDDDGDQCDDCAHGTGINTENDGIDTDEDGICDLGDNRPLVEVHQLGEELGPFCGEDGGVLVLSGIDRDGDHSLDGLLFEPPGSPVFPDPEPPPLPDMEIDHYAVVCNAEHLLVRHTFVDEDESYCPAGGVELEFVLDRNRNGYIDLEPEGPPAPVGPIGPEPDLPEFDELYTSATLCHGLNAHIESELLPVGSELCPTGGFHIEFSLEPLQLASPSLPGQLPLFNGSGPEHSYDICNGADALVTLSQIPPGTDAACKNGGYAVEMGTDLDANGEFNGEEPSTSANVCDGLNSLVKTTELPTEDANCPTGGVKVESGLDVDGDGELAAGEVDATEYVCHGTDSITKTSSIEPGSDECVAGGRQIEIGKDTDGDETLDASEVSSTEFICNGSGLAVRSSKLASGDDDCPGGGVVVETGVDVDGDAKLDDSEVQSRQPLCDAVNALFDTETLSEDPEVCAHGGVRVKMGRDDGLPSGNAANNRLEAGEVEATRDVCLASTDVLVNGGSSDCAITPGNASTSSSRWATLGTLLIAGAALRRRSARSRRGIAHEESQS